MPGFPALARVACRRPVTGSAREGRLAAPLRHARLDPARQLPDMVCVGPVGVRDGDVTAPVASGSRPVDDPRHAPRTIGESGALADEFPRSRPGGWRGPGSGRRGLGSAPLRPAGRRSPPWTRQRGARAAATGAAVRSRRKRRTLDKRVHGSPCDGVGCPAPGARHLARRVPRRRPSPRAAGTTPGPGSRLARRRGRREVDRRPAAGDGALSGLRDVDDVRLRPPERGRRTFALPEGSGSRARRGGSSVSRAFDLGGAARRLPRPPCEPCDSVGACGRF